jgi:hypothetical protein
LILPLGDVNLYRSWLRKNPYINLAAFDANDRSKVYEYVNMLPLPEGVIIEILKKVYQTTIYTQKR